MYQISIMKQSLFGNKQHVDLLRTRNRQLVTLTSKSLPTIVSEMSFHKILYLSFADISQEK